jgi:cytochrome P450 family 135
MERCRRRYGDVFSVRLGPLKRAAFVSNPEAVKAVLTGDPSVFRLGATNGVFRPVIGSSSLFLLDGEDHQRHRRILMRSFRKDHVRRFTDLTVELTELDLAGWPVGQAFQLHPRMRKIMLGVMLRAVLGMEEGERHERFSTLLVRLLDQVQKPSAWLPWLQHEVGGRSPYGRLMSTVREIDDVLFKEIKARRLDGRLDSRGDVLSALASPTPEDAEFMTDREIRDEVLTQVIVGPEDTAAALAWTFERVLRHPEPLERLVGALRDDDDMYLTAVVKEALRQRPVLPVTARKLTAPVELGEYTFPSRWTLMLCIYLLHREPSLYSDPDVFRPERFLDDPPGAHAWIPFGGGARHCLGANFALHATKLILKTVLGRVRLRAAAPEAEPVARRHFTFAPGRGATAVLTGPRTRAFRFRSQPARTSRLAQQRPS